TPPESQEAAASPPAQTPAPAAPPRSPQPTASYTYTRPPETPAPRQPSPPSSARPGTAAPPSAPRPPPGILSEGDLDDDEAIPEDALEFNPAAADVNKVFVEPPPNPEWTAATGTFKALVFKGEEPEPVDEIELDPDFLSSTSEMRKLKLGLSESDTDSHPKLEDNTPAAPASNAPTEPTRHRPATPPPQNRALPPPPAPTGSPTAGAQTFAPA